MTRSHICFCSLVGMPGMKRVHEFHEFETPSWGFGGNMASLCFFFRFLRKKKHPTWFKKKTPKMERENSCGNFQPCHVPKMLKSKNFPTYPWNIPQTPKQQFMKEFLSFWALGMPGVCSRGMLGFSKIKCLLILLELLPLIRRIHVGPSAPKDS